MNITIIKGNLGADAQVRTFNDGKVINCRVAVTERGYKTASGQDIPDHTEWFSVAINAGLQNKLDEYLKKGTQVIMTGRLRTRMYKDANQIDRQVTELIVKPANVELVGGSKQSNAQGEQTSEPDSDNAPF